MLEYAGEIAPYVLRAIAHRHEHDLEWPPWWTEFIVTWTTSWAASPLSL